MHGISDTSSILPQIKLALITILPIIIVLGVFVYYKANSEKSIKQSDVDIESMREDLLRIAKEKKAQREGTSPEQPEPQKPEEVDKKVIEEKIKAEREEYNEFELLEPIEELKDDMGTENKQ